MLNAEHATAESCAIVHNLTMTMNKLQELAQDQSDIIMATRKVPRTASSGETATHLNASADLTIQDTEGWMTVNDSLASREGRVIMNNIGLLFSYASALVATDKKYLGRHVRYYKRKRQQSSTDNAQQQQDDSPKRTSPKRTSKEAPRKRKRNQSGGSDLDGPTLIGSEFALAKLSPQGEFWATIFDYYKSHVASDPKRKKYIKATAKAKDAAQDFFLSARSFFLGLDEPGQPETERHPIPALMDELDQEEMARLYCAMGKAVKAEESSGPIAGNEASPTSFAVKEMETASASSAGRGMEVESANSAAEGKEAASTISAVTETVAREETNDDIGSQAEYDGSSDVSDEEILSPDEDERVLACDSASDEVDEMDFN